jgi:hypothetical protein
LFSPFCAFKALSRRETVAHLAQPPLATFKKNGFHSQAESSLGNYEDGAPVRVRLVKLGHPLNEKARSSGGNRESAGDGQSSVKPAPQSQQQQQQQQPPPPMIFEPAVCPAPWLPPADDPLSFQLKGPIVHEVFEPILLIKKNTCVKNITSSL